MNNFHVGQKVVCVPRPSWIPPNPLVQRATYLVTGAIYTIRDIDDRAAHWHGGAITLRLEEIRLPFQMTCIGFWERGFAAYRFRPIIERKTDISVFQKLLTPHDKVSA